MDKYDFDKKRNRSFFLNLAECITILEKHAVLYPTVVTDANDDNQALTRMPTQ